MPGGLLSLMDAALSHGANASVVEFLQRAAASCGALSIVRHAACSRRSAQQLASMLGRVSMVSYMHTHRYTHTRARARARRQTDRQTQTFALEGRGGFRGYDFDGPA